MIRRIYFWDGKLDNGMWDIPKSEKWVRMVYVDAGHGYSFNMAQIELFKQRKDTSYDIVTNQTALLNYDFVVDKDTDLLDHSSFYGRIFMFHRNDCRWTPIEEFTDRELRFSHNLEKMYRAGIFNEEVIV